MTSGRSITTGATLRTSAAQRCRPALPPRCNLGVLGELSSRFRIPQETQDELDQRIKDVAIGVVIRLSCSGACGPSCL